MFYQFSGALEYHVSLIGKQKQTFYYKHDKCEISVQYFHHAYWLNDISSDSFAQMTSHNVDIEIDKWGYVLIYVLLNFVIQ